ncbi:GNAT family N-acetyltransferase [Saccharicrinis sp. FJH62]|uniref:GNAT family N-acetyltransferase n=1 Tax=Saccharicrinis sp. FJH62 TaxID=3344657 RepID=UPI0035D4632A
MTNFDCIHKAEFLPDQWDVLADNYFQRTKFLWHTERFNPCSQRYFLCYDSDRLVAAAIVYTLHLDLFTFAGIKSPLKMNIVGVPCSVSGSGIFGEKHAVELLKTHIYDTVKGFVLSLNLSEKPLSNKNAAGKTLPSIELVNRFEDWRDYKASLRSGYRRRLVKINQENGDVQFKKLKCPEFNSGMYQQYLNVYNRSHGKLEKLNHDFFKNLPSEFNLTVCMKEGKIIGWNIGLEDNDVYYFFLGGIDYTQNKISNTYLRLLSGIVKDGIENKARLIDLGQTAETAKMRMGGKIKPLYMEAHHSTRFINYLLKVFRPLLEYRKVLEKTKALKEV